MIDATDLTTIEVRNQYVKPLILRILAKTNLSRHASTLLGIHYCPTSTTDEVHSTTTASTCNDEKVIGTLYQEIELYKDEFTVDDGGDSSSQNANTYAQMLEEAAALSAYMTRQEHTLIATIASSSLLLFLVPQCDYLNFLHSYFTSTSSAKETSSHIIDTLEERITNSMLWSRDSTIQGGSTFPYSASRMGSTTGDDNDDGFTTSHFYRFLHQGLSAYLSCGTIFCSNKSIITKQACDDLIQLIAMAICPVMKQNFLNAESETCTTSSPLKEYSMLPFSFQLSHMDRLQLLQVCKDLAVIPTKNITSLKQLRESIFGFASYVAHSDREAATAYEALCNVPINEKDEFSIQIEFQKLLQALVESKSSQISSSIGVCIEKAILMYKGNKSFVLQLFTNSLLEESNKNEAMDNKSTDAAEENAPKRQKRSADNFKPFRLVAILNAARMIFASMTSRWEDVDTSAATKLMQSATVFLQCSSENQLDVIKSASDFLTTALSQEKSYLSDKANVKHIFSYVRQSFMSSANNDMTSRIIDALKPLIVTCSGQSGTFAVSVLTFTVKTYSSQKRLLWKLAAYVAIGNPSIVSKRLSDFGEDSSDDEDTATYKIRTILSCANGAESDASSPNEMQRCFSIAERVSSKWVLFKLVRHAFQTSNYSFAHTILDKQLVHSCSRQNSFTWLKALSKMAQGEEILAINGSTGITQSMELLSSCSSLLTSLDALEHGKFNFQLEFIRLRLDTLNLISIARSLCAEMLMTEGTTFNKNDRSSLFQKNVQQSFSLIVSRYRKMYRLYGLHRCEQTRSTLRTLISMVRLLNDFATQVFVPERESASIDARKMSSCDKSHAINIALTRLRNDILEQMKKSRQKDDVISRASGLLLVIDAILKLSIPIPSGFFVIKPMSRAIVNISADPNMLPKTLSHSDEHGVTVDAESGAEIIDVTPGLAAEVILSGVLPDTFIQMAAVSFFEITAWCKLQYQGNLYEEDETADSDAGVSNGMTQHVVSDGGSVPVQSTSLLPGGKFMLSIPFEPMLQEGYYKVTVELGCRDVRHGMWIIPTSSPLEVFLRVDDERSL